MDNKIDVTVEKGVKELVIREGAAEKIVQRTHVALDGTVESAKKFYANRKDAKSINTQQSHVIVNRDALSVRAVFNAESPYFTTVNGKAVVNPDIAKLGIMTDAQSNPKEFSSPNELAKHIKFMRSYFPDKSKHASVLESLLKFSAKYNVAIEKSKEQTGSRKDNFELVVDTNGLALNFSLELPIFIGGSNKKFNVDINYDLRDRAVTLWLESVELKELIDVARKEMIDAEIQFFNEEGIVVIEQ